MSILFKGIKNTSDLWTVTMRMRNFEKLLLMGQTLGEGQEKLLKVDLETDDLGDTQNTLSLIDQWFTHANMRYLILKEREERIRDE